MVEAECLEGNGQGNSGILRTRQVRRVSIERKSVSHRLCQLFGKESSSKSRKPLSKGSIVSPNKSFWWLKPFSKVDDPLEQELNDDVFCQNVLTSLTDFLNHLPDVQKQTGSTATI
jgi:hypothetical protein